VNRSRNIFILLALAPVSACIVSAVIETETFESQDTSNYSHNLTGAATANACGTRCFMAGKSTVTFAPPLAASNVKAAGPILPIVPAPGKGTSYGDQQFRLGMYIYPGKTSVSTAQPLDNRILVEGRPEPLAPIKVEDCDEEPLEETSLSIFGHTQCLVLYFDITIGEIETFTLVPAPVVTDGVTYVLPDVEWKRSTSTNLY